MREITLDTETTGLDPNAGHRVVEIGCVEILNRGLTGRTFHTYLNPERSMPEEAYRIHGLSDDFLAGQPAFATVVADFLAFIEDAPLVIHNAAFDMKFLNAELAAAGAPPLPMERAVDTLAMARTRFPGSPATLDALCARFAVDNSKRQRHGALLDAELLADVYLELTGGRQQKLSLDAGPANDAPTGLAELARARTPRPARPHAPTAEEAAAHAAFLETIARPLWTR